MWYWKVKNEEDRQIGYKFKIIKSNYLGDGNYRHVCGVKVS